jgi:hypothetical protein
VLNGTCLIEKVSDTSGTAFSTQGERLVLLCCGQLHTFATFQIHI